MTQCEHYDICGLDDKDTGDGMCILHSENPEKDEKIFNKVLALHRTKKGDQFSHFVFPGDADFRNKKFVNGADFTNATFTGGADFIKAEFTGRAKFYGSAFKEWAEFAWVKFLSGGVWFDTAKFQGRAVFTLAVFEHRASFSGVEFIGNADFTGAKFIRRTATGGGEFTFTACKFAEEAMFGGAEFTGEVDFSVTKFARGAHFHGVAFAEAAKFRGASFFGRTSFSAPRKPSRSDKLFADIEVDFREAIVEPLDALTFRDADLRKCRFQGTDLRKAEITGASWPETVDRCLGFKIRRKAVYDEFFLPEDESRVLTFLRSFLPFFSCQRARKTVTASRPHVERLYRELKQNYEDRRSHARASDFHYGEKEMLRRNPETYPGLWFWLTLYRWMSGYGERWHPPVACAGLLLFISTVGYLWCGLGPKGAGATPLSIENAWDWLRAGFYSLQVMTLLKPEDFELYRYAKIVHAFESLAGPLLLGLFALALRQQLKR